MRIWEEGALAGRSLTSSLLGMCESTDGSMMGGGEWTSVGVVFTIVVSCCVSGSERKKEFLLLMG